MEPRFSGSSTLAEMGISKKVSNRSQRIAAIPEAVFEEHLGGTLPAEGR